MRFLHISDLHLGKSIYDYSLELDQRHILDNIIEIIQENKVDTVLICGDVYDRSVPPSSAVSIFDDFLVKLAERKVTAMVISGNHDSGERLDFGSRLMNEKGVYIKGAYNGSVDKVKLSDSHGPINFFLLPFVKPAIVKGFFPDEEIKTWTDGVSVALAGCNLVREERNVILAHQFVTGAIKSDTEEINVGGADNVDGSVFQDFDYVALGHLHRSQQAGSPSIRYCGTAMKYSFSEVGHNKTVTLVEMKEKANIHIEEIPVKPLRDMVEIKGLYMEITSRDYYKDLNLDDYYRIILTDEEDQPDGLAKLRVIYPNLMRLDYDNKRTRSQGDFTHSVATDSITPLELFESLYEEQNGQGFSEEQGQYLESLMVKLQEDQI